MVARELLDAGDPRQAFALCAAATPASVPAKVDAAFHAGWIALRFLGEAAEAARHFDAADAVAATPLSIARAGYWRGRAAEALGRGDEARRFYERAAAFPIAYYGQLAAERLGRGALVLRAPAAVAPPEARDEATRVVAWLYAAGLDDLANALAQAAAGQWSDEGQLAALADVVAAHGDAAANVAFGKIVTERGFALDASAFPLSGVPQFAPLAGSADLPSVYAVARQESEFARQAASGMGARGLMQILPSTAQDAARRAGVPFNAARLISDPAFNVQLGAAYPRPNDRRSARLGGARARRLQRRRRPRRAMARRLWRPARRQGRPGRLGRAHPVRRDARLCRARQREHRRLPRPLRLGAGDDGADRGSLRRGAQKSGRGARRVLEHSVNRSCEA